MYIVKGYCASLRIFEDEVGRSELEKFLETKRAELKNLELIMTFGLGEALPASELCCDVYEKEGGRWRCDLSTSFKIEKEVFFRLLAKWFQAAHG